MASPQLENGYTKIAHELIERLVFVKMSGTEWQYVMCVIRKTYGWGKKEDWITNSQIVEMTGLKKERVSEAKNKLLQRNIITDNFNRISIQKDWEKWNELRKSVTHEEPMIRKSVTIVTEKRNKVLRKSVHTIDRKIKDIISDKSQRDMSWKKPYNENSHSDDLPALDMDSREEVKPAVKKKEKKVSDDVQAVFDLFNNPAKGLWRMREIERVAAQILFDTYGLETLERRVKFIEDPKNKKDPFFPLIFTPSQLLDKTPNVDNYFKP